MNGDSAGLLDGGSLQREASGPRNRAEVLDSMNAPIHPLFRGVRVILGLMNDQRMFSFMQHQIQKIIWYPEGNVIVHVPTCPACLLSHD